MIFCTPKDKVTHCVREILNDWDGNGDKNSGMGTHSAGTVTQPVGKGIDTTGWLGMGTNSCPCAAL